MNGRERMGQERERLSYREKVREKKERKLTTMSLVPGGGATTSDG